MDVVTTDYETASQSHEKSPDSDWLRLRPARLWLYSTLAILSVVSDRFLQIMYFNVNALANHYNIGGKQTPGRRLHINNSRHVTAVVKMQKSTFPRVGVPVICSCKVLRLWHNQLNNIID